MNIEKIKQAIELSKLLDGENCSCGFWEPIGTNVFIRTVTLYYTGRVKAVSNGAVTLEDAAWIADTGRFTEFLKEGKVNEVEVFQDDVHVPLGSIIDVTKWRHKLPRDQK